MYDFDIELYQTRFIEKEMSFDGYGYAWVCEMCDDTRCFEYSLPEDSNFNFCPKCGRKIIEFVYKEVEEEE